MPSLHLKGYQPDSFPYGFHMVWTVFRHSFSLLFWKMSENDHIASVDGCEQNSLEQTFSLSLLLKNLRSGWNLIAYLLLRRIDYKKHLTCFYKLYGYYLEFLSACHDLHEPVDFWTKSCECKHPNIIKGKQIIWLLFWLSWPIYFAASCL